MIRLTNTYTNNTIVVVRGDATPIVIRPGETVEVRAQVLHNVSVLLAAYEERNQ